MALKMMALEGVSCRVTGVLALAPWVLAVDIPPELPAFPPPECQPSGPLGHSPKPLFWLQRPRQCSEQLWRDETFAVKSQLRDAEICQTQPSAATSAMDMVALEQS